MFCGSLGHWTQNRRLFLKLIINFNSYHLDFCAIFSPAIAAVEKHPQKLGIGLPPLPVSFPAIKREENLRQNSSPRMEPILVEKHEQDVKEAGGDHHQRHRPAEQGEHGQFSVVNTSIHH